MPRRSSESAVEQVIANALFSYAFCIRFWTYRVVPTNEVTELVPVPSIRDFGYEGLRKDH